MKKLGILILAGVCFLTACKQNPENGGEEIRGNEQRSDTALEISNYPGEGDSLRYSNGNSNTPQSSDTPARSGTGNAAGNGKDTTTMKQ